MGNLGRSLLLGFSLIATSFLVTPPSWAESVFSEPVMAEQTITDTHGAPAGGTPVSSSVEVTELTIQPPLSPEQEKQLVEIDQDYQSKLKKAVEDYETSLKNFESLLGTNPETDILRQRYQEMLSAGQTLRELAFNRLMDFREVLTPEQKASLSDDVRQILDK